MNFPNKITLSRILLVPVFMIFVMPFPDWMLSNELLNPMLSNINEFILQRGNYIAAIIFIIAVSTDRLDGYIARKRNMVTQLGIFLDPIADKLIIIAALVALVQRNEIMGWTAMLIIAREFIVTGFRLVAAGESVVMSADKWGKIKMFVQSFAISLALLKNYPLSLVTDFPFSKIALFIAVLTTIFSGVNYIWKNRKLIHSF